MHTLIETLLPADLSAALALLLVLASALTSAVTASFGVGGGVLMLAILALALPPAAIIPVHGLVQLGSNVNRAAMAWRHINGRALLAFAPGVLLGAWLASRVLVAIPLQAIQLCIALFVLLLCWGPAVPKRALGRTGTFIAAVATTFVSMFVGASGPLVAAFIKQQNADRFATVATFAAAMSLQHAPKALLFGAAGFAFAEWLGLVAAMIAAGAVGTWLGLRVLGQLGEQRFERIFKLLLSALALRLLWAAGLA